MSASHNQIHLILFPYQSQKAVKVVCDKIYRKEIISTSRKPIDGKGYIYIYIYGKAPLGDAEEFSFLQKYF